MLLRLAVAVVFLGGLVIAPQAFAQNAGGTSAQGGGFALTFPQGQQQQQPQAPKPKKPRPPTAVKMQRPPLPSSAEGNRILAVVNDEMISVQDLEGRIRLAIGYSNIPDTPDTRSKIAPQVLRKMIDERLQIQEANRLKVVLTPEEVDQGIQMIEKKNNMPAGALISGIASRGGDPSLARDQIRADLTWLRLVNKALRPQIRIGTAEVQDRLESMKGRLGRSEYLLAEILLPVDNPSQEGDVRRLSESLLGQMKKGTPFSALARQFSRASSAANGGSLGWVSDEGLDQALLPVVTQLGKGQVSIPVRTAEGFTVLMMLDRRVNGGGGSGAAALPSTDQVRLALEDERLDMLARRYIRDLRRAAYLEFRK